MKKIVFVFLGLVGLISVAIVGFKVNIKNDNANAYLRVHIRANSNETIDQTIKYEVKTAIVDYLTPKIVEGSSFEDVYSLLKDNLENIEKVADNVLKSSGFSYVSKASLKDEYFPTRSYGEYTLEDGFYDALIIELGEGKGNNWWCVVYPPLCFIGSEGSSGSNIKYKSKLMEIIQNFFG